MRWKNANVYTENICDNISAALKIPQLFAKIYAAKKEHICTANIRGNKSGVKSGNNLWLLTLAVEEPDYILTYFFTRNVPYVAVCPTTSDTTDSVYSCVVGFPTYQEYPKVDLCFHSIFLLSPSFGSDPAMLRYPPKIKIGKHLKENFLSSLYHY